MFSPVSHGSRLRALLPCLLAAVALLGCDVSFDVALYFSQGARTLRLPAHPDAGERPETDESDAGTNDAGEPPEPCAGACVPALDGWLPVLLSQASEAWALDACPAGYEALDVGGSGLAAPPATCAACACSPHNDGACSLTAWGAPIYIGSATCGEYLATGGHGSGANVNGFTSGACRIPSYPGAGWAARSVTPWGIESQWGVWNVSPGSCEPKGGAPTFEPIAWETFGRACVPAIAPSGACSEGSTCAASVPGFSSCIMREGEHACPDGSAREVFYRSANDARTCTPCTCGSEQGGACRWGFSLFGVNDCSGEVLAYVESGPQYDAAECTPIEPAALIRGVRAEPLPYVGGVCPASGGEPTGSATAGDPVTLCCSP